MMNVLILKHGMLIPNIYVLHYGDAGRYSPALTHDKVTVVWFKLKSYCPSTLPVPKYSVEVKHQTKNFNHFAIG